MRIIQLRDEMLQDVVGGDGQLIVSVDPVVDSQPLTGVDKARDRLIRFNEHAAMVLFRDGVPTGLVLGGGSAYKPIGPG